MGLMRRRGDEGNVSLLALGLAILVILLIFVGAAVTGVHLDRMRLSHVADELALDAADSMDVSSYYSGGAPLPTDDAAIMVSLSGARRVVSEGLDEVAERYGLSGVEVVSVVSVDGRTVTVTIRVVVHPIFGIRGWLPLSDVTLTATSSARVH